MKTLSRTCAVAGATALLTVFAGAGAAAAQEASVTAPDQGTLLADGAAVTVSVTFDCDSGKTTTVLAETAQTVDGHRVATGFGASSTVTCADGEETVEVALLAVGGSAFTEGEAAVRISLFTCDPMFNCEDTIAVGVARFTDS